MTQWIKSDTGEIIDTAQGWKAWRAAYEAKQNEGPEVIS